MMLTSLEALIHKKVVILNQEMLIESGAKAMRDQQVGYILLTDGSGHITGIITHQDLVHRWIAELAPQSAPLKEIMTRNVISANENSSLADILHLMEAHGVRAVPIINEVTPGYQRAVGVVCLEDIIASELIDIRSLSRIVRRQVGQKSSDSLKSEKRSETHGYQALDRFYAHITQVTGLPSDLVPQVTQLLLESLAMRVTYTVASHWIAQLPKLLQQSLMKLPPGPIRKINSQYLVDELALRFTFTEDYSRTLLHQFLSALDGLLDEGQMKHFKAQLPEDILSYFRFRIRPPEDFSRVFPMKLTSRAFSNEEEIPEVYTSDGLERSPPLEWSQVPVGTKEFAIICEGPDIDSESPRVHWVIFNISPTVTQLPEGIPARNELEIPILAKQGRTFSGKVGYEGPAVSENPTGNRYYFWIYALDHEIILPPGATAAQLTQEMRGHIIGEDVLIGTYSGTPAVKTA
jgi:Raf kinase inhibitor-like YbhB/YbcL family protein